jgi:cation transport regulator ChaB
MIFFVTDKLAFMMSPFTIMGFILHLLVIHSVDGRVSDGNIANNDIVLTHQWDPFPLLAKDYHQVQKYISSRRRARRGLSYADLSRLRAALHQVEPQAIGTIQRVYMCQNSAIQFQSSAQHKLASLLDQSKSSTKTKEKTLLATDSSSIDADDSSSPITVAMLLGTIGRELRHKKSKARTSLSSTTEDQEFVNVCHVHAIWQPLSFQSSVLSSQTTWTSDERVRRLARYLGIRPVGWIFAYKGNVTNPQDTTKSIETTLPMSSRNIYEAAILQSYEMRDEQQGREDGSRFLTMAMDATSGATEAFLVSDITVQMVAEGVWDMDDNSNKDGRFVTTRRPVVVDGQETNELDTLLCLVNVALLSHDGMFAQKNTKRNSLLKRDGRLSASIHKALNKALNHAEETNDDSKLLEMFVDFNLLYTIDALMQKQYPTNNQEDAVESLCQAIRKYTKGQKQSIQLDHGIRNQLRQCLG